MSRINFPAIKSSAVAAAILLFTSSIPTTDAHSWVEQVRRIAPNGTFVGAPGYARGTVPRGSGEFGTGLQYLLPPNDRPEGPVILDSDDIAKDGIESYTEQFPQLIAAPGEPIALLYQENGHVSKPESPENKPANRGTVFIYATEEAKDDDKLLSIHPKWDTKGTGGDKRGKLIATRNYDDGQCTEFNPGPISTQRLKQVGHEGESLWCQVDVIIPEDAPVDSIYTMFWVWDWPTLGPALAEKSKSGVYPTQGEGVVKPELYTSAIDIKIVAADDPSLGGESVVAAEQKPSIIDGLFDESGDVGNMAIKEQLSNMFIIPPPNVDAPPSNGEDENTEVPSDDENTEVPSAGTEAPASSALASSAPASSAPASSTPALSTPALSTSPPSVTEAPEEDKVTVTVTVTKEPTTLYTVVTKVVEDTAEVPTPAPTPARDGIFIGDIGLVKGNKVSKRRGWGFGLF